MRNSNKILLLVLCLTLIFAIIFSLSACDKQKDVEKDPRMISGVEEEVLSRNEIKLLLSNMKVATGGGQTIVESSLPYDVIDQTYNDEKFLELKTTDGHICVFKDDLGKYIKYDSNMTGGAYCKLTKPEYDELVNFDYALIIWMIDSIAKIATEENEESKALMGDLYKYEIGATRDGNGGYIRTQTRTMLKDRYSRMNLPCDIDIKFKIFKDGTLKSCTVDSTYVEEYMPPNYNDGLIPANSFKYTFNPNIELWIPEIGGNPYIDNKNILDGNVTISISDSGSTFADGTTKKEALPGSEIDLGIPKHDGFTDEEFLGWYSDDNFKIKYETENFPVSYSKRFMFITPKWKQKDNVLIDLDGAIQYSGEEINTKNIVTYEDLIYLFTYKEGYNFEGWYTSSDFSEESKFLVESIPYDELSKPIPSGSKFYAKYVKDEPDTNTVTHMVTFKPGDIGYKALDVKAKFFDKDTLASSYEVPKFIKENKVVGGWYLDEKLTKKWNDNDPITKDLILYPKYEDGIKVIFTYLTEEINETAWVVIKDGLPIDKVITEIQAAGPTAFAVWNGELFSGLYTDLDFLQPLSELSEIPATKKIRVYAKYDYIL